jgi:TPR repeat protein
VQLFTKAAKLGDSNSIYWLGYLYHNGIGVEKDTTKAVALLNTAVSEQHSGAMFYLSQVLYHWEILLTYLQMYRVGDSVPQSTEVNTSK